MKRIHLSAALLVSCLSLSAHAAEPPGDVKNLTGTYAVEMAGTTQPAQPRHQCLVYLMEPSVPELEGDWHAARPRVDSANMQTCDAMGAGYAFAWSYTKAPASKIVLMAAAKGAGQFMEFKGSPTLPKLYLQVPKKQNPEPKLVLRQIEQQ